MKRAEAVAQGYGAGEPRGAVFAFAHFHKAEIEGDCGRGDVAEWDARQLVAVPDATGEEAVFAARCELVGQRTDGEADFPVMRRDKIGSEIALGSVGRAGEQPREGGGEFVAETGAGAKTAFVFGFGPELSGVFAAEHRLEAIVRFADIVPESGGVEHGDSVSGKGKVCGDSVGGFDNKLRVPGDGLP